MAEELINTRCGQGRLIITDRLIRVKLGGMRQQTMNRSALTGVDSKLVALSFFGLGGGTTLTFHGQGGEVLRASLVKTKVAKQILQLLGY